MAIPSQAQQKDPAVQASQLIVRLGLFILAIVAPCAAVATRHAIFSLTAIGAILILIGATLSPHQPTWRRLLAPVLTPTGLVAVFLTAWIGLTLAWTPWLATGSERYFKTIGTFGLAAAAAGLLPARTRTSNLYLLPIGVGAAAVLTLAAALLEPSRLAPAGDDLPVDLTLARGAVDLVMLVWPALAALAIRERWISAGAVAGAAAVGVIAVWTPWALTAMAVGALVVLMSASSPRPVSRILATLFGLLFVLAPLLALAGGAAIARMTAPPAFLAPIPVWAALVKSEGLRLVTGHGIDAASRGIETGVLLAATPRSILFEVWYEYGVIGALAAAALVACALLRAGKAAQPLASFMLGALACGLIIAVSGLLTTQLWWITMISIVGLWFSVVRKAQYRTERPKIAALNDDQNRSAA